MDITQPFLDIDIEDTDKLEKNFPKRGGVAAINFDQTGEGEQESA